MGIDGIEFHKSYHQNLGTFQEASLFQNFFGIKFCLPLVKSHFKNTIENHFFLLQGVKVSHSHENNSLWEGVGRAESIEKS